MTPFVVLSLPRSRSYWLSHFLSTKRRRCEHDPARFIASRHSAARWFDRESAAAVDTGLGLIWAELAPRIGREVTVAVVHRDPQHVMESLRRAGASESAISLIPAAAKVLAAVPGRHFSFADLEKRNPCAKLFEYCTGERFDEERWRILAAKNLQCDRAEYERDMAANAAGMSALFRGEAA